MRQKYICTMASLLLAVSSVQAVAPAKGIRQGGQKLPEAGMPDRSGMIPACSEDLPVARFGMQSRPAMGCVREMPARLKESENYLIGYNWLRTRGMKSAVYRFNTAGSMDFMWSSGFDDDGYSLRTAWMRDGRLCALHDLSSYMLLDYIYTETDPFSGEILYEQHLSLTDPVTGKDDFLPFYLAATYDPTDDTVWGYSHDSAGSGYAFFSAKADDLQHPTAVVDKEEYERVCVSLCYNEEENALFGINRNNDFVCIARDGSQEVIMPTGLRTEYSQGGIFYEAADGCYYWNAILTDGTSALYCIDAARQTVTPVIDFDGRVKFPFIGIVQASGDPAPVSKPVIDRADFGKGSNNGVITVFMPENLFTGQPVSGDMLWAAYVDGEEYDWGNAKAGERVAVEFNGISDGFHTFSFDVTLDDGRQSTRAEKKIHIGYDIPSTPVNITIDDTKVSWDPVIRGVNNGYLDMENLTYHIYMNDVEVGTVTNDTSFVYSSDPDTPYAGYVATVMAENHGKMSEMSEKTDVVRWGKPWGLDIHLTPTREELMAFTTFDLNEDGSVWEYVNLWSSCPTLMDPYVTQGVNDWIFTPAIEFDESSKAYRLEFDICNPRQYERGKSVQVYLCNEKTPEKYITELVDFQPADLEWHHISAVFNVAEPGLYYIAFRSFSQEARQGSCYIKEIDLTKTDITTPLPAAVTDLTAEAAPRGVLEATVEFSMPVAYLNGGQIPADEDITVEITAAGTTTLTGRPGEKMQTVVETVQGLNDIRVVPVVDEFHSQSALVNVYCGVDVPGPAMNVTAAVSEDNLSMHLTWERPDEVGDNGYYVDPTEVEYVVMRNTEEGWIEYDKVDKDTFEYTFTVEANRGLKSEWVGIAPCNVAGRATTYAWMSDMLGTPYPLPVEETFEGNTASLTPLRVIRTWDEERVTDWGMVESSSITGSDEHGVVFAGNASAVPVTGCMMLPKFSTEGVEDAGMTIDVWTGANAAEVMLLGEVCDATELVQLASFQKGNGWLKHKFRFPENFQNRKWITIFVVANYRKTSDYAMIAGYSLDGGYEEDGVEGVGREAAPFIAGGGMLRVYGHAGQTVRVYGLDGSLVREIRDVPALLEAPLAPGLYVVTAGTDSAKVIIR